jgi:hypothetical protein
MSEVDRLPLIIEGWQKSRQGIFKLRDTLAKSLQLINVARIVTR